MTDNIIPHSLRKENAMDKTKCGAKRDEVYTAIDKERNFQDSKHGSPSDNPHSLGAWILAIEAELHEAKLACLKGGVGRNNVVAEITQIAATCVAALEQHGVEPIYRNTL